MAEEKANKIINDNDFNCYFSIEILKALISCSMETLLLNINKQALVNTPIRKKFISMRFQGKICELKKILNEIELMKH